MEKEIHIISFDIPSPADYGGVIDIYYKIKGLEQSGYKVHLHTYLYHREPSVLLNDLCSTVSYYRRKTGFYSLFSILPYIVRSRRSDQLIQNLLKDNFPILFEGIHTCGLLDHPALKDRLRIVRLHNNEHMYYMGLASSTGDLMKKMYYITESWKNKIFERKLRSADFILPLSPAETDHYRSLFGGKVRWIAPFHESTEVTSQPGRGNYILIHGNLRVVENDSAVTYLLRNVLNRVNFPVIIAGHGPSRRLKVLAEANPLVKIIESPSPGEMGDLIRDAHVHLLVSFQNTGIKLKLINALFKGRFVVTNTAMAEGSGLENTVKTGKDPGELAELIDDCLAETFTGEMILLRKEQLKTYYTRVSLENLLMVIEGNV